MALTIKVNGENLENFQTAKVSKSIENLCGAFSFTSTAKKDSSFPIKVGDLVQISADDITVLTGYVETLRVNYNDNSHSINVTGRDLLCDLIDSSVGKTKEFKGNVSFLNIARKILDDIGLTNIQIIDESGGIDSFKDTELTSANVGDGAFEFLEKFARKRQILLTTNGQGNLVLTRAGNSKSETTLYHEVGGQANNIKSANLEITTSNRYNKYSIQSQLNPTNLTDSFNSQDISNQSGSASDSLIRNTRFFEMNAEESSDSQTLNERASWESNIRRARSLNYSAKVQGHSFAEEIWRNNTQIRVKDDFCNINAILLIKSLEYTYDINSGSETALTMTYKDAYTLQAEQDQRESAREKTGDVFYS